MLHMLIVKDKEKGIATEARLDAAKTASEN